MPSAVLPDVTRLDILGVQVVDATAEQATAGLWESVAAGQRPRVAFLNAHASNLAAKDADFARALDTFTVLSDGIGVDLAAKALHGRRFRANLNGTDFVPALFAQAPLGTRVFLLGGRDGVAAEAARAITTVAPQVEVVGVRHGFFSPSETSDVVDQVRGSGAEVLVVAFGNPLQEKFIAEHFDATQARMALGVGALLDFLSGRVERAPQWVRRLRAEWLWRLAKEPRRMWRRYVVGNVEFLARVARQRLKR